MFYDAFFFLIFYCVYVCVRATLTHRPRNSARVDLAELYGVFLQELLENDLVLRYFSSCDADPVWFERLGNRLVNRQQCKQSKQEQ